MKLKEAATEFQRASASAAVSSELGTSNESTHRETACASGGAALKQASIAVSSGLYDVIVVGQGQEDERPLDRRQPSILSYVGSAGGEKARCYVSGAFCVDGTVPHSQVWYL
ncbi:MAG: beta-ketoacyl synthase N-terminal-like domain-containing protein [Halobacteriota archaeon]